ncbi:MAG TPA: DUF58 domain-containing protein [Planctomycetota bacterium]|nr:DUF58 domain-containing protein [Planctomycetota bacterium]
MSKAPENPRTSWLSRLLALAPGSARPAPASELAFPPDFLSTLERLRLVALKAIGGGVREGHRLGAYKGGQLEFHGHRSYSPGDDLRYIDWNTYARIGKPFVKEFAREEAGVVHLLLDATPSMALGRPDKWTFARRVAALFSHVALASNDVVFINIFRDNQPLDRFPSRGAKGGIRELLRFLEESPLSQPLSRETDTPSPLHPGGLSDAVQKFLHGSPARGRVIVISDFWHDERDVVGAIARLSSSGFDPAGIHVLAPEELSAHADGELLARSLEEDTELELSAGGDLAERYSRELEAHCRAVEESFRKRGGNYLRADSSTSIENVLITSLRQRRWMS